MVRRYLTLLIVFQLGGPACIVGVDESVLDRLDGRGRDVSNGEGGADGGGGDQGRDGDVAVPTTCSNYSWKASASGVTLSLNGIWGSSVTDIWAVGTAGTIVHFDGSTWSKVTPSPTINNLYAVAGRAANDLWAVGSQIILHFDGVAWKPAAGASDKTLRAVWVDAGGTAWAVGDEGAVLRYDGTSWTAGTPLTTHDLRGVWGSGPQDVWAVGDEGTIRHHDGTAWSNLPPASQRQLDAVRGLSASEVWSTGVCTSKPNKCSSELLALKAGKWTSIYTTGNGEQLHALWPIGPGDLAMAGEACCDNSSCSCGRIRRYWNGQTVSQSPASSPPLRAIWGRACDLWAVGDRGAIYRYSP